MAHKVKEIRARLDEVAADRAKFHLSPRSDDRHVVRGREMSYSFVQASDVIGRGQDKDKIVEYLMDPSDGQSISVVPVVGIGESLVETMQVCTSLRCLEIDNCGGLISLLPILKFLTTLEALVIENCEKLDLTEMEDNQDDFPTSLRALGFTGLPQLVAMPDWIKRSANSLQILLMRVVLT
ncbi:hypothetical protein CMV_013841 [Castanea mollissima]|uniref:Uncharacterized protein n=1 Tax=Castanea mollissima TaxID=60419 RepID=A0A8J4RCP8_9ROSI|nr:hypothetical protein CMV_013841 [Castanea mollissima]